MACTATAISHNRGRHGERRRGQRRGHRHCWQCCCKLLCSKSLLVVRLGGQRVALRSYEICNRRGALRECRNLNTRLRFELLRQRLTHTHKLADDGRICTGAGSSRQLAGAARWRASCDRVQRWQWWPCTAAAQLQRRPAAQLQRRPPRERTRGEICLPYCTVRSTPYRAARRADLVKYSGVNK